MSVIQQIRDKYARWAVIAIALSLLGFILMDAFAGRSNVFGGNSTTIGRINNKKIDYIDFERQVKAQEEVAQQQGMQLGEEGRQQIIERVWNQEVDRTLLSSEFAHLGLAVPGKEINDMLFGDNPPQDLRQNFTDPNTGTYNPEAVQQYFTNLRKSGTPEQKAQMNQYLESLELQRMTEKYTSMLANSVNFPKWFLEKQNADNNLQARASFIMVPYTSIPDASVKVSDEEIKEYMNENKKDFEQKEETRSISYVTFSAAPSAADSVAVRTGLETLKPQFAAATDPASFLTQQGSTIPFFNGYVSETSIQVPNKDSIIRMPAGSLYGPYLDANNYVLAKKIDSRLLPDSVKVRHILLGTVNAQTGQPIMPDSVARFKADSVAAAIRGGANFDTLEARYSTDLAAHQEKGVMTFSSTQIQSEGFAPEFAQFILFNGKPGSREVVKTNFGYHYIEIMEHRNMQPHHKIAYLSREIVASQETDNAASSAASSFAGSSNNLKAFNSNYDKNLRGRGINKLEAMDIRENDYAVTGLGSSRPFVKAVFEGDANEVLQPFRVGDNYVVAAVTEVNEEGMMSVRKARAIVEPILRNRKKAAEIRRKLGNITTLESASTAVGQPIQVADSVTYNSDRTLGFNPKVVGAIFNPANKGKVVPEALEETGGVYVVRVENVYAVAGQAPALADQRRMLQMQARQGMMYNSPTEALRKAADIKDNRSNFY